MFFSEFIVLNTVTELVEALHYKFRMFGIPIEGPTNIFCNNEAVYKNASTPYSILKKKNVIICYHKYREVVTAGVARIVKEGMAANLSDLFTTILVQIRRETLLDKLTYSFICKVVLFERQGSGFLPKKVLPLPPYRGVANL